MLEESAVHNQEKSKGSKLSNLPSEALLNEAPSLPKIKTKKSSRKVSKKTTGKLDKDTGLDAREKSLMKMATDKVDAKF